MFQRAQRACVDFAVLPLVLFSVWGGPSLGQTQTTPSAQPADTGSLTVKLSGTANGLKSSFRFFFSSV